MNKPQLISLIKDDLTNCKLVEGLNRLGLDAKKYSLNLPESICELMEPEGGKREALVEFYHTLQNQVITADFTHFSLEEVAELVYGELQDFRK